VKLPAHKAGHPADLPVRFEDYGLKWSVTLLLQMEFGKEHKKKGAGSSPAPENEMLLLD